MGTKEPELFTAAEAPQAEKKGSEQEPPKQSEKQQALTANEFAQELAVAPQTAVQQANRQQTQPALNANGTIQPATLKELWWLCQLISKSPLCPKQYIGKPGDILIAFQLGAQVGLNWLASLQNICTVNGRPAIWGRATMGLVRRSPYLESWKEWYEGSEKDGTHTAHCEAKRKGDDNPCHKTFSMANAKAAGLLGKDTYKAYLDDMLMWRARHRVEDVLFPDVLMGLIPVEIARDEPPLDVTPSAVELEPTRGRERLTSMTGPAPQIADQSAPFGFAEPEPEKPADPAQDQDGFPEPGAEG